MIFLHVYILLTQVSNTALFQLAISSAGPQTGIQVGKASHAFSSRLDYQEITDGESRSGGNELDSSRFTCFRPQHTTVANIQTSPVYTNTTRKQS